MNCGEGIFTAMIAPVVSEKLQPQFQKRALDLFSGTGSVGQRLREWGYEVISVDINPNVGADVCVDILKWPVQKIFPQDILTLLSQEFLVSNIVWHTQ